jgi:hypothetical protein
MTKTVTWSLAPTVACPFRPCASKRTPARKTAPGGGPLTWVTSTWCVKTRFACRWSILALWCEARWRRWSALQMAWPICASPRPLWKLQRLGRQWSSRHAAPSLRQRHRWLESAVCDLPRASHLHSHRLMKRRNSTMLQGCVHASAFRGFHENLVQTSTVPNSQQRGIANLGTVSAVSQSSAQSAL